MGTRGIRRKSGKGRTVLVAGFAPPWACWLSECYGYSGEDNAGQSRAADNGAGTVDLDRFLRWRHRRRHMGPR